MSFIGHLFEFFMIPWHFPRVEKVRRINEAKEAHSNPFLVSSGSSSTAVKSEVMEIAVDLQGLMKATAPDRSKRGKYVKLTAEVQREIVEYAR